MTDFVATDSIWIDRENRQRKVITIDDLIPSVAKHGILQPILINADHKLMAGERRLTTALHLGLTEVPVRFFENLSEIEQQLVELEENMRRRDLTWQETCLAVLSIDRLHKVEDPEWTIDQTCVSVGLARRSVENYLKIGKALEDEDENITKADTLSAAITIHTRRSQREQDAAAAKLLDAKRTPTPEVSAPKAVSVQPGMSTEGFREIPQTQPSEAVPVEASPAPTARASIQHTDALEFFSTYEGERFNLLHCDFPYGVVLHGQANQAAFEGGGYDSNEEIYWNLMDGLEANLERMILPSAHIMFWISMKYYTETIERLSDMGWKMNPVPLIWHKTDNKGILPDAKRGPRQTYEAALIGSMGDRFIVKPVANSYGAPTDKSDSIHTNEKPQPMLNHFLSMFVDEHTRLLDPTCGSGSAVRSAEGLGAEFALGLEHNPDFAERAEARLRSTRALRQLSAKA